MNKKSLRPQPVKPVIRMNSGSIDESPEGALNPDGSMAPSSIWSWLKKHFHPLGPHPFHPFG